jgi:hypothetical protein
MAMSVMEVLTLGILIIDIISLVYKLLKEK